LDQQLYKSGQLGDKVVSNRLEPEAFLIGRWSSADFLYFYLASHNPMSSTPEPHPYFPSGEWEGFYTYPNKNAKDQMATILEFSGGKVSGSGSDIIGSFAWEGIYDIKAETCSMTKFYMGQHVVYYDGYADENGIWGSWTISEKWKGKFHIWPKGRGPFEEHVAVIEEQFFMPA
jgi:hypothetical protein